MTFAPDYIDVAERRREFFALHPAGSFQGEGEFIRDEQGKIVGFLYRAFAYRSPDDVRPGVGTAFEPIPGKTPYTKDSEVMNCETSAWGRAILAACGIESKKIASADEVQARQGNGQKPDLPSIPEDAKPSEYVIHFGKNRGTLLGSLSKQQLGWYAEKWEVQENPSDYDRRLKAAAFSLYAGDDTPMTSVPADLADVPF